MWGTSFLLIRKATEAHQSNIHDCHFCWLPTITRWKDLLAEDTIHSVAGHRNIMLEMAWLATFHVLRGDVQAPGEAGCQQDYRAMKIVQN